MRLLIRTSLLLLMIFSFQTSAATADDNLGIVKLFKKTPADRIYSEKAREEYLKQERQLIKDAENQKKRKAAGREEALKKFEEKEERERQEKQAKRWKEDKALNKYKSDGSDLKAQKHYTKEGEELRNKRTGQFEPQGGVQYKKFRKPSPPVANSN